MKIVTWNMDYWQHRKEYSISWDFLNRVLAPEIVIAQEAIPPLTSNSLRNYVWREIGKTRKWGSGIFSKYPVEEVQFDNHYLGSVIAGEVTLPNNKKLTVISIHALLEHGYSIIPLHRIFSALTLLLERKMGKRTIIIIGDFNASIQFDKKQRNDSQQNLV